MSIDRDRQTLEKLEGLRQEDPQLEYLLEPYAQMLKLQLERKSLLPHSQPHLSQEQIASRVASGEPLVSFDELAVEWGSFEELFQKIASLVSDSDSGESPAKLATQSSLLKQVTREWYEGSAFSAAVSQMGIAESLLSFVLGSALYPFVSLQSAALMPLLNQETWRRGRCPICGGKPDLCYLEPEVGARWLLCSRCGAEWLFQRLECPFCGSTNQNSLAYFTDDSELYRLYVCEGCRHYIKAIDLRKTKSPVWLPMERILSMDMDEQAQERGYTPG